MEIEAKLIPKIVAWSKSGEPVLNLAGFFPAGEYETVCIIPDYRCLHDQEDLGRIDEYHSSFGRCIPENDFALMLVGDHKAHAALIDGAALRFDVPFYGKCVPASDAVLRTAKKSDSQRPIASLEQQ